MLSNSIPLEYTIEGINFMILKETVSNEISLEQLKEAEKLGKEELELRWSLSTHTNYPHILEIDEQRTGFYKNSISLPEKYAFRKGILMKMVELATSLETITDLIEKGQETAVFLDYSLYSEAIILFEAPISDVLAVSKEYLSTLSAESHLINSDLFPLLLNEYTPIPYHRYQNLSYYRHVYLTCSDIEKNSTS